MDSRVVMSPVCSDQGTARVIKGSTSVPFSRLPPRAVANPPHGGQRSHRRGDRASICEEPGIGHMASLGPAPAGESSPFIRVRQHDALVRVATRGHPAPQVSPHRGPATGRPQRPSDRAAADRQSRGSECAGLHERHGLPLRGRHRRRRGLAPMDIGSPNHRPTERQQRPGLRAADRSRHRSGRQVVIPFSASAVGVIRSIGTPRCLKEP